MRDILTSPRVEDMKRKAKSRRVRLGLLLCILTLTIFGALAYFSGANRVTIHTTVVTGTRIINAADIQASVENDLSGKYLYLFAKRNVLIYPHRAIYNDLIKTYPRIETLSVYRDDAHTLHIAITERAGSFLYCGAEIPTLPTDVGENCYFINNDGYIFDKAPYFSGNVYFKYYTALPGNPVDPRGLQMLPPEIFHGLVRFIDRITLLGFKPTDLTIGEDGVETLYLYRTGTLPRPLIMFKKENSLPLIVQNLTTSMAKAEFANEINSKYATLQYIDLRFKNKVLYKFHE